MLGSYIFNNPVVTLPPFMLANNIALTNLCGAAHGPLRMTLSRQMSVGSIQSVSSQALSSTLSTNTSAYGCHLRPPLTHCTQLPVLHC